jgi:TolB-like protein
MLAGRRPFTRDSHEKTVAAIRNEDAAPLSSLRPELSGDLAHVVDTCLDKDPARRYQDAKALLSALSSFKPDDNSGRTAEESEDFHSPGQRIAGRRQSAVLGASVILLAVVAGTLGYSRYSSRSESVSVGTATQPVSIAVLPFVDSTNLADGRYQALAFDDELRAELGRIPVIGVPAYFSSRNYERSTKSPSQIADEMGSSRLVMGAVVHEGTGTFLRIRLVDGKRESHSGFAATMQARPVTFTLSLMLPEKSSLRFKSAWLRTRGNVSSACRPTIRAHTTSI